MIDPNNITKYDRTDKELEDFWIFCWFSKAANAKQLGDKLNSFFDHFDFVFEDMGLENLSRFQQIRVALRNDLLRDCLSDFKLGKYESFIKGFWDFQMLDLRECSLGELESIHGVGSKIARMFLLHSRPNQKYLCLDTHLLKEAKKLGIIENITPPNKKQYLEIEENFISYLLSLNPDIDFAKFDLNTWSNYANKTKQNKIK